MKMTTLDDLFTQHGKLPDPTTAEEAKWKAEFERKQAILAALPDEPDEPEQDKPEQDEDDEDDENDEGE